jgi:hypothetical protein
MLVRPTLLIALLAASPPVAAQTRAVDHGWYLGGGVDALRFGRAVVTDGPSGQPVELRPSGRVAFNAGIGRSLGVWDVRVEVGLAEGHIEGKNDVVAIRDLTAAVSRYRLALGIFRRILPVADGELGLELAPTLDLWSVTGEDRVRGGAEGRLILRAPLGSWDLEQRIGFGISGSPIEAADVGDPADQRAQRTFSIGLGVRTGL